VAAEQLVRAVAEHGRCRRVGVFDPAVNGDDHDTLVHQRHEIGRAKRCEYRLLGRSRSGQTRDGHDASDTR